VIISKPAIHDHFKTGQLNYSGQEEFYRIFNRSDKHFLAAAVCIRQGDRARGISAERFEIPLAGGAAVWAAWGEPARPGFPRRGNGKGEIGFLAAAG
jgi:hypothetical protein